jgi:hypothetical protein
MHDHAHELVHVLRGALRPATAERADAVLAVLDWLTMAGSGSRELAGAVEMLSRLADGDEPTPPTPPLAPIGASSPPAGPRRLRPAPDPDPDPDPPRADQPDHDGSTG